MRIDSSTANFSSARVAKAYGLNKPDAASAQTALRGLSTAATQPASLPPSNPLVAAKVSQSVEFDAPRSTGQARTDIAWNGSAFQMYTRAADKVEAAVAVQIGRLIDLTG